MGNNISRETNLELNFTTRISKENLGSDYPIFQLEILHHKKPRRTETARLTNEELPRTSNTRKNGQNFERQFSEVVKMAETYTKCTMDMRAEDTQLPRFCDDRRGSLRRSKKMK